MARTTPTQPLATVSMKLHPDDREALEKLARQKDWTLSHYLRRTIQAHVQQQESGRA